MSRLAAALAALLAATFLAWGAAPQQAAATAGGEEATLLSGGGDFLSENGLDSPLCREAALAGAAREGCEGAQFTGTAYPLGNYAFDVHIDTGFTEPQNDVAAATEDLAQWLWLALLAVVRVVLVLLEWAYSLHLLGGILLGKAAAAIGALGRTLTLPGLAFTLTVLAGALAYNGLIRRRHAQSVAEAAASLAMVLGGLVLIANPPGTVGEAAALSDQAAVGALAAFSEGGQSSGRQALAAAVGSLFGATVNGPWCFLEFGAVSWCSAPRALDPPLRDAALAIAGRARAAAQAAVAKPRRELLLEASHLEAARTNGELFLSLPANGPARNSINETGSLLHVLCGGSFEATHCRGPTARQAEFRTEGFLGDRLVGLVLIFAGTLGAILLFGWVVSRLLGAAVLALLLLFAAPAVVVAPPLGLGGRNLFRGWAVRLAGALTAKLLFSVLLGCLILLERALAATEGLGFWLYWLLAGGSWWLIFLNRNHLLAAARFGEGAPWREALPGGTAAKATRTGLRAGRRTAGRIGRGIGALRRRRPPEQQPPAGALPAPRPSSPKGGAPAGRPALPKPAKRSLGETLLAAELGLARASERQQAAGQRRELLKRLERLSAQAERSGAALAGGGPAVVRRERRREASLAVRQQAVRSRLAAAQERAERAGRLAAARRDGETAAAYDGFIALQRSLPPRGRAKAGRRRAYSRLAPLIGLDPDRFSELVGAQRLQAILAIDRVLAGAREPTAPLEARPAKPTSGRIASGWFARERRREAARMARGLPGLEIEERIAAEESYAQRLRRQLRRSGGGAGAGPRP